LYPFSNAGKPEAAVRDSCGMQPVTAVPLVPMKGFGRQSQSQIGIDAVGGGNTTAIPIVQLHEVKPEMMKQIN
jgi:hypothetical protein